jgi:hydrogenase-4 membrane subunit HyfE
MTGSPKTAMAVVLMLHLMLGLWQISSQGVVVSNIMSFLLLENANIAEV